MIKSLVRLAIFAVSFALLYITCNAILLRGDWIILVFVIPSLFVMGFFSLAITREPRREIPVKEYDTEETVEYDSLEKMEAARDNGQSRLCQERAGQMVGSVFHDPGVPSCQLLC